MNNGFFIGFLFGLIGEVIRLIIGGHRRDERRMWWELFVICPTFLSFSFLTGASVEWIGKSENHLGAFIACTLIWVATLWVERIIERNGIFLSTLWEAGQEDGYRKRCAALYSTAVLLSTAPYIAFAPVLEVHYYGELWWIMVGIALIFVACSFVITRDKMCVHIDKIERETIKRFVRELVAAVTKDRLMPLSIENLDKFISEERPAKREQLEHAVVAIQRALYFAQQFGIHNGKELLPGVPETRLRLDDIKKLADVEIFDFINALNTRFYMLKLLVVDEREMSEVMSWISANAINLDIDRLKGLRERLRKKHHPESAG